MKYPQGNCRPIRLKRFPREDGLRDGLGSFLTIHLACEMVGTEPCYAAPTTPDSWYWDNSRPMVHALVAFYPVDSSQLFGICE